jgi:hypothetical protein
LDHSPLKLLDTGKHATEDKRFFLSEHLLNVGLSRRNLINLAHFLSKQPKDFDLHLIKTFNEVMNLTLYAHADPVKSFEQLEHPT